MLRKIWNVFEIFFSDSQARIVKVIMGGSSGAKEESMGECMCLHHSLKATDGLCPCWSNGTQAQNQTSGKTSEQQVPCGLFWLLTVNQEKEQATEPLGLKLQKKHKILKH